MKVHVVIVVLLGLGTLLRAAESMLLFDRFYAGHSERLGYGRHFVKTTDGGYVIIANDPYPTSPTSSQEVLTLIKTNVLGVKGWQKVSIQPYATNREVL